MNKRIHCELVGSDSMIANAKSRLFDLPGVQDLSLVDNVLHISYDLAKTNASEILAILEACRVEITHNRWQRIRLWIRRYQDSIIEQEANNEIGWDSFVREIYVSRYRHRRHGRRDDRPRHWRQYASQKK